MPSQKDLKKIVRARMEKTGEAYTAARLHRIFAGTAEIMRLMVSRTI